MKLIADKLKEKLLASIGLGENEWDGLDDKGNEVSEKTFSPEISLKYVLEELEPYIKRKMKESFEAGFDLGWSEASKCDFLDGSEENPGYNNFKEYFKKKYK